MTCFKRGPFCAAAWRVEKGFKEAFTLRDLLALLSAMSLLTMLIVPALSVTRGAAKTNLCQTNMRTLLYAWQLYAGDHNDTFVLNHHGGGVRGPMPEGGAEQNWARGWLTWDTSPDNTNVALLRTEPNSLMAPYLAKSRSNVHKCPEDIFLSRAQRARHWKERVRSVVMNATVGGGNARTGPWDSVYASATNYSEMNFPGPSQTSVFLEEHPDSINDTVAFPPFRTAWVDWFAGLHKNAATASFADGRVELHQWRGSLRNARVIATSGSLTFPRTRAGEPDLSWVSFHSNRRDERSY